MRLLAVVSAVLSAVVAVTGDAPSVRTEDGWVSGVRQRSVNSVPFYAYHGIPFARPPLGHLRLQDPLPAEPWEGVRDGTKMPKECLQVPFGVTTQGVRLTPQKLHGVEDCLYLNVFTPVDRDPKVQLPVIVWIHGGGFFSGGALEYLPLVLLDHDVVLVVVQYRTGVLGFLSTEDSTIPGNFGLKDQTLALQWVQRNIHNFGGDKTKVTIAGESAGGASVHYQMLTPKSKGLFSRVIMQSGTAISPWAQYKNSKRTAEEVGVAMGCPNPQDSHALLSCLQKVDGRKLASLFQDYLTWFVVPLPFVPRVDGDFLPEEPAKLMLEGRYHKVDLLAGVTADEGGIVTLPMFTMPERMMFPLENNFSEYGPVSLQLYEGTADAPIKVATMLYDHYLGEGLPLYEEHSEAITQLFSDSSFNVWHDLVTRYHARHAEGVKTYRYEFKYRGELSFGDYCKTDIGKHWVVHADDLYYIFAGGPMLRPRTRPQQLKTREDLQMRRIVSTLWTNFAATGNPTPDDSLGFKWQPSTEDDLCYAALNLPPTMEDDQRQEVRDFFATLPFNVNQILQPEKVVPLVESHKAPQDEL